MLGSTTVGTRIAAARCMEENKPDRERGAQEVSTGEREAMHRKQDLDKVRTSTEGRDGPPADADGGKRDEDSPWLGGG